MSPWFWVALVLYILGFIDEMSGYSWAEAPIGVVVIGSFGWPIVFAWRCAATVVEICRYGFR